MWTRPGDNVHVCGRERSRREGKEGKREMRGRKRKEGEKEWRGRKGGNEEGRGRGCCSWHTVHPWTVLLYGCTSSYTSNSRPPHTAFVACMQVTKAVWSLIHLFLAFLAQVSSAPGVLGWESLWAAGRAAGEEVWVWEDADGTWGDGEGPQTLSTGAGETEEEGEKPSTMMISQRARTTNCIVD